MSPFSGRELSPPTEGHGLFMRKLIRSRVTEKFLTTDGKWTTDVQKARHFPELWEAVALIHRSKLFNVEHYYCFGKAQRSELDFTVTLQ